MKKTILFIFLPCLIFGQESIKETYYKNYNLTQIKIGMPLEPSKDKMDVLVQEDVVEESALKDGEYYFMVKQNGTQIVSIGYYDNKGNIKVYLLDRYYNIYFNYITYQYQNEVLTSKEYKDTTDRVTAKIEFEYNENKKITKTKVFVYSLLQRKLVKIEETNYSYEGENYSLIERLNMREQTYSKYAFKGQNTVQEYERFDIDGKTLQYKIVFVYDNGNLSKKKFYSKSNVLLKTVYEETKLK